MKMGYKGTLQFQNSKLSSLLPKVVLPSVLLKGEVISLGSVDVSGVSVKPVESSVCEGDSVDDSVVDSCTLVEEAVPVGVDSVGSVGAELGSSDADVS